MPSCSQPKKGTILGPKGTETIVSMNLLVEELGYEVTWTEGRLKVTKGDEELPVEVMNGTPMLPNEVCLNLIHEIEEKRRTRIKALKVQASKEEEFQITSIWPQLKELLTWLMKNDVMKGLELLKVCFCRRRRELDAQEKRIEVQKDMMMEQVKDRKNLKCEEDLS